MGRLVWGILALALIFALFGMAVFQAFGGGALLLVTIVGIASLFLLRFLVGRMLRKAFEAPFAAKGAVLKNAQARVHSVTPTSAPARDPDEELDEDNADLGVPRAWYLVDTTIIPAPATGPFQMWEPGELGLAGPEAQSGPDLEDPDEEEGFRLYQSWIRNNGEWEEDEGAKYEGAQELRLLICAPLSARRARLRYYFEVFGEIELPQPV
jgi:hypothetical protein